jgi:hypothetical protein
MNSDVQKKRHHYIPVAYLKGFCDATGRVLAYRKDEPDRPLHVRPSEIAFERYYYLQPMPEGGQDNNRIEDFFSTIESEWPPIVGRMRAGKNLNPDLEAIFTFLGMMRVRVPAIRDMVELAFTDGVKASARILEDVGMLPPPPPGLEAVRDWFEVSVDPHQSIHAMANLARGFADIVDRVGLEVIHNTTDEMFVTSDNPVIYFDPDVPEQSMLPYTVHPACGSIELLLPVDASTVVRGRSDDKRRFTRDGIRHVKLTSRQEVRRINRLIVRFGYRFIFARDRAHEALVRKHANRSPVFETTVVPGPDGARSISVRSVFGKRRNKVKWTGLRER